MSHEVKQPVPSSLVPHLALMGWLIFGPWEVQVFRVARSLCQKAELLREALPA